MTRAPRSAQKAAQQADQAADQLLDWLRQQRGGVFAEMPDAVEPDAMPADQARVGGTAPRLVESILGGEDYIKADPTGSVSVELEAFGWQDLEARSQYVLSLCRSTGTIEAVEALPRPGAGAIVGPPCLGNADAGVEERTSPLRGQSGAEAESKEPSPDHRDDKTGCPLRLSHTDWLHHRLVVTGPAATLADFQAEASGAGIIPWALDRDRMEEDLFHILVAPPAPQRRRLSLAGARVLARQLGEAAEARHAAAAARAGQSRACPFDLYALLPVPPDILPLGPDHPDSEAWLWAHWGTIQALRHVVREPALPQRHKPPRPGTASLRLSFWSADWTPWQALTAVAARWPALRFDVTPTYDPL